MRFTMDMDMGYRLSSGWFCTMSRFCAVVHTPVLWSKNYKLDVEIFILISSVANER